MLQKFVRTAGQLIVELGGILRRDLWRDGGRETPGEASGRKRLNPLQRVLLTDGVSRTLFNEYASHREGMRGEEETGWLLLGLRETEEAVALATLPAGTEREAGVAHVQFNSMAQAVGCRIVRQMDRRLTPLGVVHTHPGSLRHPSDGDFRGDSQWVALLRGREGVFGIGTANGHPSDRDWLGRQPRPHMQVLGKLCLSWYALAKGDANYRPLNVELTLGPDLARPLHSVWTTIEAHAERLERLACQQAGLTFDLAPGKNGDALAMTIPLAEPGDAIRVLLEGKDARYFLVRGGDRTTAVDPRESRVDQGVYLLLAELASQS